MGWEKTNRKYSYVNDYGHIVVFKPSRPQLEPFPEGGDVWVVSAIFTKEEHRGQGHSLRLLAEAASTLTRDQGTVWLGLMRDVLTVSLRNQAPDKKRKEPAGKSSSPSQEAQVAWDTFCSTFSLEREGSLAKLEPETSWSVT